MSSARRGGHAAETDASRFVPAGTDLDRLAQAAAGCRGCELYRDATQTVFGDGAEHARLMLVGEQPGDVEDRRGEPFVGPAGRLLDRALADVGLPREDVYLTNAVKHFRWKASERGKRRIHQRPDARHIRACRPWLSAELASVRPHVVVALGAVAAQSLLGPAFRLTQHRGERLPWPPPQGQFAQEPVVDTVEYVIATIHPSAVLRADAATRDQLYQGLVDDLTRVAHS